MTWQPMTMLLGFGSRSGPYISWMNSGRNYSMMHFLVADDGETRILALSAPLLDSRSTMATQQESLKATKK